MRDCSFYGKKVDADNLLSLVGLTEKKKSYVTQLSGGQKQRFSIIAALVNNPEIIFLDEPTTGLHFSDIRKLLAVLQKLTDSGNSIVVIEHNLDVIKCAETYF